MRSRSPRPRVTPRTPPRHLAAALAATLALAACASDPVTPIDTGGSTDLADTSDLTDADAAPDVVTDPSVDAAPDAPTTDLDAADASADATEDEPDLVLDLPPALDVPADAATELPASGELAGLYYLDTLRLGADDSLSLVGDTVLRTTTLAEVSIAGRIACAAEVYGHSLEIDALGPLRVAGSVRACDGAPGIDTAGDRGGHLTLRSGRALAIEATAAVGSGDGGPGAAGQPGGDGGNLTLEAARIELAAAEGVLHIGDGGAGGASTLDMEEAAALPESTLESPYGFAANGGDSGRFSVSGELTVGGAAPPLPRDVALVSGGTGGAGGRFALIDAEEGATELATSLFVRGASGGDGAVEGGAGGEVAIGRTTAPGEGGYTLRAEGGSGGSVRHPTSALLPDGIGGAGGRGAVAGGAGPSGDAASAVGGVGGSRVYEGALPLVPVAFTGGAGGAAQAYAGASTNREVAGGAATARGGQGGSAPADVAERISGGAGGAALAEGGDGGSGVARCAPPAEGGQGAQGGAASASGGDGGNARNGGVAGDGGDAEAFGGRGGRGGNGTPPGQRGIPGDSTAEEGVAGAVDEGAAGLDGIALAENRGALSDGGRCPVTCQPNAASLAGGEATLVVVPTSCPACAVASGVQPDGVTVAVAAEEATISSTDDWTVTSVSSNGTLEGGVAAVPLDEPVTVRLERDDFEVEARLTATGSDVRGAQVASCGRPDAALCDPLTATISGGEARVTVSSAPGSCSCAVAGGTGAGALVLSFDDEAETVAVAAGTGWTLRAAEDDVRLLGTTGSAELSTREFFFVSLRSSTTDHEVTLQLRRSGDEINAGIICDLD